MEDAVLSQEPGPRRHRALVSYMAGWAVLVAGMMALLWEPAAEGSFRDESAYRYAMPAAAVLAVLGPLVAVLFRPRPPRPDEKRGTLALALSIGCAAAFAGVVLWAAAIVVLDLVRTGWLG